MKRLLVIALILLPALSATAKQVACQSVITSTGSYDLGVRDEHAWHFYAVEQGQWFRQKAEWDLPLPPGAVDLYANDRELAIRNGSGLDFYSFDSDAEGTRWRRDGSMPLPIFDKRDVIVGSPYTSERELLTLGRGGATLYSEEGRKPFAKFTNGAPDPIDCAFGMLSFQLAIVSGKNVLVYVVVPGKTDQELRLAPLPEMTYILPKGTDEVMMFRFEYLGIRRGHRVHFVHWRGKAWVPDDEVPDLDLDARERLPVNDAG